MMAHFLPSLIWISHPVSFAEEMILLWIVHMLSLDRPVYVLAKAGGPFEHCGILIHDNIESCKV